MKQQIVGSYYIGGDQIQVVLREGTGGELYNLPEKGVIARMKVGADYEEWRGVLSTVIHEALEFVLAKIKARFTPRDDWGFDDHAYLFVIRHPDFSDACGRLAEFLDGALPDIKKAWAEWQHKVRGK